MRKEKLNLESIKNVLTRSELKKIMAGSGGGGGGSVCCGCNDGGNNVYLCNSTPTILTCQQFCYHNGYANGAGPFIDDGECPSGC